MIKKVLAVGFSIGAFALLLSSCGKKDANSPGYEFMPDMYRSPSVEVYNENTMYADSLGSRQPVNGTIPRGFMPYPYANDTTGYGMAGRNLKNPIALSENVLKEGEELYVKFCVHCHGATGAGDGKVGAKLPGAPPSFTGAIKNLPEGKIFHSITYGKGLMGPHAAQLTQEERWKLTHYVQKLQHANDAPVAPKEEAKAEEAKTEKK